MGSRVAVLGCKGTADQLRTLAHAERSGGSLYRVFAEEARDQKDRAALLECDSREKENAEALADSLAG